jgi:hypothetical protein
MAALATGLFAGADTSEPDGEAGEQEQDQQAQDQQGEDQGQGDEPSVESLQAEIARLKNEAAANRIKAKNATSELKRVNAAKTPEGDAVAAAEARGREAARLEYGIELAQARVEGALKGVVPDESIADIVDDLNLSRFVTDEGKVDEDAVKAIATKYQAIIGKKPARKVNHARTSEVQTTDQSETRELARSLFTTG